MTILTLTLDTKTTEQFVNSGSANTVQETLKNIEVLLKSVEVGGRPVPGSGSVFSDQSRAYAEVIMASATGSQKVFINNHSHYQLVTGSAKAQDWARNITSVINASTGSAGLVIARMAPSGTVDNWRIRLEAVEAGAASNLVPLSAAGTGLTVSSALMASGSSGPAFNFTF